MRSILMDGPLFNNPLMPPNKGVTGLLGNPLFTSGIGLLANNGRFNGVLQGLQLAQQYRQNSLQQKLAQMRLMELQKQANAPDMGAPVTRDFIEGNTKVTKQWDALTGEWVDVSKGPRWNPNSGMQLNVGPDGQVSFAQGRPIALTDSNRNKVQEKQFNTMEHLARLGAIQEAYRPEFQQFGTRAGAAWTSLKEKAGVNPSPEEQQQLNDISVYRRHAVDNLNTVIKQASGATVTTQEEKRLKDGMPNPGLGIFDGDSPTEFQAKLDATVGELQKAAMRYHYAQIHGLDISSIPLSSIESMMDKRGSQLETQFMKQGMTQQQAERAALEQVRKEFGL
ncbi:MAG: hypothetical protein ABW176_13055 [Candidatus Thiodiazotropha endolucinida]